MTSKTEGVGAPIPDDGLTGMSLDAWATRWPMSAERVELVNGCPVWVGGPWDGRDVATAERCFGSGWRAQLGEDGYGLTLRPATWRWRVRLRNIDHPEYGVTIGEFFLTRQQAEQHATDVQAPHQAWVDELPE